VRNFIDTPPQSVKKENGKETGRRSGVQGEESVQHHDVLMFFGPPTKRDRGPEKKKHPPRRGK